MNDPFAPESDPDDWDMFDIDTAKAHHKATGYQMSHVGLHKDKPKRKGKTPEALVSAKIYDYYKRIGAIVIRTNAGSWKDADGNYIQGAKAGTSDLTVCLPQVQEGVAAPFCATEVKAAGGIQSDAQKRYQARVERLGGLYILAESAKDVQSALVAKFGFDVVLRWENRKY